MEKLILPEYQSVVFTDEQFEVFMNDTIVIETDYLDGEECLYTTGVRGEMTEYRESNFQVTGFYVYTTEHVSGIKGTVNRLYYFNSLAGAFDCYTKIKNIYQLIELENITESETEQRRKALSKFTSHA